MAETKSTKRAVNFIDLTGKRFGRLSVVSLHTSGKVVTWNCICDCGKSLVVIGNNIRRGLSISCGCSRIKIGIHQRSEYKSWHGAKMRCTDPKNPAYANYGGRGISMCRRWLESFDAFYADMGPRPKGMTLDRRDNDGPYSPENCRWATPLTQMRNRRITVFATHEGETLPLTEWAKRTGIGYTTLLNRWKQGQPMLTPRREGELAILHNGEIHSLREWSRILGIPISTLRHRRRRGTPPLFAPWTPKPSR